MSDKQQKSLSNEKSPVIGACRDRTCREPANEQASRRADVRRAGKRTSRRADTVLREFVRTGRWTQWSAVPSSTPTCSVQTPLLPILCVETSEELTSRQIPLGQLTSHQNFCDVYRHIRMLVIVGVIYWHIRCLCDSHRHISSHSDIHRYVEGFFNNHRHIMFVIPIVTSCL